MVPLPSTAARSTERMARCSRLVSARGKGVRRPLGVDAGLEEHLVDVDVAEAGDESLIEEHAFDLARPPAQLLLEPGGGEVARQRLQSQPLLQAKQIVAFDMDDAAKLALVRETKIGTPGEVDGQPLEAQRRLGRGDDAQRPGHAQMDDDGGAVVQIENEVLRAAADFRHGPARDPRLEIFEPLLAQHAGKVAEANGVDLAADDLVDQRAADGFDFGKFWHTRLTFVARREVDDLVGSLPRAIERRGRR